MVGREFNMGKDDALYASTPPLEALGMIVSNAGTYSDDGQRRMVMINDVRCAYFYAKIQRDVYVDLPKEDPASGTGIWESSSCASTAPEMRPRDGRRP